MTADEARELLRDRWGEEADVDQASLALDSASDEVLVSLAKEVESCTEQLRQALPVGTELKLLSEPREGFSLHKVLTERRDTKSGFKHEDWSRAVSFALGRPLLVDGAVMLNIESADTAAGSLARRLGLVVHGDEDAFSATAIAGVDPHR